MCAWNKQWFAKDKPSLQKEHRQHSTTKFCISSAEIKPPPSGYLHSDRGRIVIKHIYIYNPFSFSLMYCNLTFLCYNSTFISRTTLSVSSEPLAQIIWSRTSHKFLTNYNETNMDMVFNNCQWNKLLIIANNLASSRWISITRDWKGQTLLWQEMKQKKKSVFSGTS